MSGAHAFVVRHVVTFEETNVVGNVYFVNYLRWQGQVRETFLYQRVPGVADEMECGLRLVTTRCACEFYLELAVFDEVEIRMTLERQEQNRVALAFDYMRTSRGTEELVARGSQEIAFLRFGTAGLQATRPPAALLEALAPYTPA